MIYSISLCRQCSNINLCSCGKASNKAFAKFLISQRADFELRKDIKFCKLLALIVSVSSVL